MPAARRAVRLRAIRRRAEEFLEGKMVVVKLNMPAAQSGVDVHADAREFVGGVRIHYSISSK